jgi:hypothetical protein
MDGGAGSNLRRALRDQRVAVLACVVAIIVAAALTACGTTAKCSDPPLLVPWTRVGNISLGEPFKQVAAESGRQARKYRLHGGTVSLWGAQGRVNFIDFTTRYYRTKSGFGVGSRFPQSWRRAFIWNGIVKLKPCGCWVRVGTGKRSLSATGANFGKPWVIVYVSRGRFREIFLSQKYLD